MDTRHVGLCVVSAYALTSLVGRASKTVEPFNQQCWCGDNKSGSHVFSLFAITRVKKRTCQGKRKAYGSPTLAHAMPQSQY
jgi:hypothetical protein